MVDSQFAKSYLSGYGAGGYGINFSVACVKGYFLFVKG
jgi:hypothetical protein